MWGEGAGSSGSIDVGGGGRQAHEEAQAGLSESLNNEAKWWHARACAIVLFRKGNSHIS